MTRFVYVVMSDMATGDRFTPWLACESTAGAADEVARVMRHALVGPDALDRTPAFRIERVEVKP